MELFRLLGTIAVDNTEANEAIQSTTDEADNAQSKTSKAFGGIGKAALTVGKGIVGAGAAIGGAFIAAIEGTREYRKEMGMLEAAYKTAGHSTESAKKTYSELNAILGDSGQAVEASQHLAKLTDSEKELQTWTDICTGVYATFGESLPIEGLTEASNETAKTGILTGGLTDALNWAGISEEKFQEKLDKCSNEQERQKLIMDTLNGTYKDASEQYKETNKDIIESEKAQGRMTDAMARIGEIGEPIMTMIKNAFAGVLEKVLPLTESLASKLPLAIGKVKGAFEIAMPYLEKAWDVLWMVIKTVWNTIGKPIFDFVVQAVQKVVAFFQKNFPAIKKVVQDVFTIIKNLWNSVLKPVLTILGNYVKNTLLPIWKSVFNGIMKVVQTAFDGIIKLWNGSLKPILSGIIKFVSGVLKGDWTKAWNGIKQIVSGVFSGIKTTISTAISVIKTTFSSGFGIIKTTVSKVFGTIKSVISTQINAAKDIVKKVIDKIKGFFNISLKFKGIKMPSIKLTMVKGSGLMAKAAELLGLDGVPKFTVKWNAEGGILTKPTIFGLAGGTWLGGGEAGNEVVAPIDVLQDYVRNAVKEQNNDVIKTLIEQNRILIDFLKKYMPREVILDGGVLVGELAPAMDVQLGKIYTKANRGSRHTK